MKAPHLPGGMGANYSEPAEDAVVHVFGCLMIAESGGRIIDVAVVTDVDGEGVQVYLVTDADRRRMESARTRPKKRRTTQRRGPNKLEKPQPTYRRGPYKKKAAP